MTEVSMPIYGTQSYEDMMDSLQQFYQDEYSTSENYSTATMTPPNSSYTSDPLIAMALNQYNSNAALQAQQAEIFYIKDQFGKNFDKNYTPVTSGIETSLFIGGSVAKDAAYALKNSSNASSLFSELGLGLQKLDATIPSLSSNLSNVAKFTAENAGAVAAVFAVGEVGLDLLSGKGEAALKDATTALIMAQTQATVHTLLESASTQIASDALLGITSLDMTPTVALRVAAFLSSGLLEAVIVVTAVAVAVKCFNEAWDALWSPEVDHELFANSLSVTINQGVNDAFTGLSSDTGTGLYNSLQEYLDFTSPIGTEPLSIINWKLNTDGIFTTAIPARMDPLLIDLNGDGFHITPANHIYFDIDGDQYAEATSWNADANDGFLVRDLNANGRIDGIQEMFGTQTVDGFTALRAFDDNHDGIIDSNDAIWSTLQVWKDENLDGQTLASELHSLASLGITGINVGVSSINTTDINGGTGAAGTITDSSTVTTTTGTLAIGNAQFFVDQRNSDYVGSYTIDPETYSLPDKRGYNNLMSLRDALNVIENSGALTVALMRYATNDNERRLLTTAA